MDLVALDYRTPAEAEKTFIGVLSLIKDHLSEIQGHREKQEAVTHWAALNKAAPYLFREEDKNARTRWVGVVNSRLSDLEKLFAGQMTLFASLAAKVVAKFLGAAMDRRLTVYFNTLHEIVDNLDKIYERDIMRNLGLKPSRPPADRPKTPRPAMTYAQAQAAILKVFKAKGWGISADLKIPHATSPSGQVRFWFKPQAIYLSRGPDVKNFNKARSIFAEDYRNMVPENFVNSLIKAYDK